MSSGELINSFLAHSNYVLSLVFSPNGEYLASGSGDKTIGLWSIPKGELVKTLLGHSGWVRSVVFS